MCALQDSYLSNAALVASQEELNELEESQVAKKELLEKAYSQRCSPLYEVRFLSRTFLCPSWKQRWDNDNDYHHVFLFSVTITMNILTTLY